MSKMNYLKQRKDAFGFAFSGLSQAFKSEANLKLHFIISVLVVIVGAYFSITKVEWLIIFLCMALVISIELINSAFEKLCDMVIPEKHPNVEYIKDVSAAAVLVASIISAVIGIAIFWPYVNGFFR
jgi:diacylglycerol kinase